MPTPALIAAQTTELVSRAVAALAAFIGDSTEEAAEAGIILSPSVGSDLGERIGFQLLIAALGSDRAPVDDMEEPRSGGLQEEGWAALAAGDSIGAMAIGDRLLELAGEVTEEDWNNFGSLLHDGHIFRSCSLLRRGDVDGATAELDAAGQTPGSPTLNSFGPDITLAWELLQQGQDEAVIKYFHDVSRFWSPIGPLRILEMRDELTRSSDGPEN